MNRKVHLLGELSKFGETWEMEAKSIGDAVKLIDCQKDGFRKFLIDAAEAGLDLAIVGKDFLVSEPEELIFDNLGSEELYLSLVPAGSGKGWGKIILGIILVIVGVLTYNVGGIYQGIGMMIGSMGVSFALQGITQLLAKTPDGDDERQKAGMFDGPVSTLKQGQPVPILYGKLLIGGIPIHVNLTSPVHNRGGFSGPSAQIILNDDGTTTIDYSGMTEAEIDAWHRSIIGNLGKIV